MSRNNLSIRIHKRSWGTDLVVMGNCVTNSHVATMFEEFVENDKEGELTIIIDGVNHVLSCKKIKTYYDYGCKPDQINP